MVFDYERSKERRTLTSQELGDYYWKTFSPVINILLIGLKSDLRAQDIPALAMTQGELYTIRDLPTDWKRGTINIPGEVLSSSGLTSNSSFVELANSRNLQDWFGDIAAKSKHELLVLQVHVKYPFL